jgi:probable rRNA maturation factor
MILNRQRAVRVARRPLDLFLRRVRRALGLGRAELTVCLVSDAEIARMNEMFRRKKGPTDVLSFPAAERSRKSPLRRARRVSTNRTSTAARSKDKAEGVRYLGDVAISPATARRNAKRLGRALPNELRVLILHGTLHLLGYDHETDSGQMDRLEQRLRQRFKLA